jgi:large subunit ribosomal protein L15
MLHKLPKATQKKAKRVGRGVGSGKGKTSARGMMGQKARPGKMFYAGFEGGQTGMKKRIPKLRGFRNPTRIDYEVVNLGQLAKRTEAKLDKAALQSAGLISKPTARVKLLANGEISRAVEIEVDKASAAAVAKIEAAGGKVVITA